MILPDKRFLLIKRAPKDDSMPGFWELPSGGIDEGENMETSLVRETLEEVGVDISSYDFKKVDEENYSFKKETGDIKNVTETTFVVFLNEKPGIRLSQEHVDFQWVGIDELYDVYKNDQDLIYKRVHRVFKRETI